MRTRIAPSPTGYFHLGSLRTTLLNYLMAKANGGTFVLRIDDTDQHRNIDNRQDLIDYIYKQMDDFGLTYDITFTQSSRLDRHADLAKQIGTRADDDSYFIPDMVGHDGNTFDMTILRANGYPTYNFASTLDDFDYDITHIIRGVDHITNAVPQRQIWDKICAALDVQKPFPELIHAGLLTDKAGRKISKRMLPHLEFVRDPHSLTVGGLVDHYADYDRRAILNWVLKMGWSHKSSTFDRDFPIMTMDQMIDQFNGGNINQANSKVFRDKLDFYQKKFRNLKQ